MRFASMPFAVPTKRISISLFSVIFFAMAMAGLICPAVPPHAKIIFNLLAPYGKVLVSAGPLRITQGSLFTGLEKALTLTGLLMLSRACIKSDLRLPGTIGFVLGESFRLLELMREKKNLIRRGHIIAGIDEMMLEMDISNTENDKNIPPVKPKRTVKSILLLCLIVLVTAAVWLIPGL